MESVNFVLCGLGGQGILFMTKILAQTALNKGMNVMGAETHGMAQRGGSVVAHLRLGDMESSLVGAGKARFLLALEESEAYRNLPFLAKKGQLYVNASGKSFPRKEVGVYMERIEAVYRTVAAGEIAMDLGAPRSENLALIGLFAASGQGPWDHEDIRATVDQVSRNQFKEINLKAFDAGFESWGE